MTFGQVALVLLTGHVVGDFYLQSDRVAAGKEADLSLMASHCAAYLLGALLSGIAVGLLAPAVGVLCALGMGAAHALIDVTLRAVLRHGDAVGLRTFVVDQAFHVFSVLAIAGLLIVLGVPTVTLPARLAVCLAWGFALLLCGRPFAIAVRLLLVYTRGEKRPDDGVEGGSGRLIGILERVIVACLTLLGQYAAIAFVMTAKSVARFKRLEEDADFAEAYLVGTLASVCLAMMGALAVRGLAVD